VTGSIASPPFTRKDSEAAERPLTGEVLDEDLQREAEQTYGEVRGLLEDLGLPFAVTPGVHDRPFLTGFMRVFGFDPSAGSHGRASPRAPQHGPTPPPADPSRSTRLGTAMVQIGGDAVEESSDFTDDGMSHKPTGALQEAMNKLALGPESVDALSRRAVQSLRSARSAAREVSTDGKTRSKEGKDIEEGWSGGGCGSGSGAEKAGCTSCTAETETKSDATGQRKAEDCEGQGETERERADQSSGRARPVPPPPLLPPLPEEARKVVLARFCGDFAAGNRAASATPASNWTSCGISPEAEQRMLKGLLAAPEISAQCHVHATPLTGANAKSGPRAVLLDSCKTVLCLSRSSSPGAKR